MRNPVIRKLVSQLDHDIRVVEHEPIVGEVQMDKIMVQKTTTFHDEGEVKHDSIIEHMPTTILNPAPDVDLMNFIARPIVVYSSVWNSALTIGTVLTDSLFFPNILLNKGLNAIKLSHIYMYRPDIEISIRINCTPMHYGRLMIAVYPLPEILPSTYINWRNASGAEWYQLSANREQTVLFTVPYRNVLDWLDLTGHSTEMIKSLFKIVPYVAVPLSMVDLTSDTSTSVTVQFYARFINPRFCGYTTGNVVQTDMESSNDEVQQQSESRLAVTPHGYISRPLHAIGDFLTIFRKVPVIGAFVGPLGQSVRFSADLLKAFGFSVPVNAVATQPITFKSTHYNCCDDNPNSIKLGSSQDMGLSKDFEMVYDSPDCMNILKMCQRPFLIYTGKITSIVNVGDTLYTLPLAPQNLINLSYATPTRDATAYYPSMMAYLSTRLGMWRGGIRVCISFISSSFHSMRVRAMWEPSNMSTGGGSIDSTQDIFNIVMDINDHRDYIFTIPYMKDTHWCFTKEYDLTLDHEITNGSLTLQAMTKLTSSSAVVNPIYYQIFVSAAADFQFAMPTNQDLNIRGYAQSGGTMLPSTSHLECMRAVYPPIGGINQGVYTVNRNTSYVINSVRQLITPLTLAYSLPTAADEYPAYNNKTAGINIEISPYSVYRFQNPSTNVYGSLMYAGNHFMAMRLLFLFHRGATRVSVISDAASDVVSYANTKGTGYRGNMLEDAVIQNGGYIMQATIKYPGPVDTVPHVVNYAAAPVQVVDSSVFDQTDSVTQNFGTGHSFGGVINKNQLDVTLPYFSVYNCRHVSFDGSVVLNDGETLMVSAPAYRIGDYYRLYNIASGTGADIPVTTNWKITTTALDTVERPWKMMQRIKYRIYIAAGDDYIMGVQLPVPACKAVVPLIKKRSTKVRSTDIVDTSINNNNSKDNVKSSGESKVDKSTEEAPRFDPRPRRSINIEQLLADAMEEDDEDGLDH